MELSFVKII